MIVTRASAGVLVTAVFTLITPLAANSGSIYFLYTVQITRREGGWPPNYCPLTCPGAGYRGAGGGGHLPRHARHAGQVVIPAGEEQVQSV